MKSGRGGVRIPSDMKKLGRPKGSTKPDNEKQKARQVSLSPDLWEQIDEFAQAQSYTRSKVFELAIIEFLKKITK